MAKITSEHAGLIQALVDSGLVDDPRYVRRVVIDIEQNFAPVVYIERYTDERLINVITTLSGVEIRREDKP